MSTARTVEQALERWSPVFIAQWVDQGLIDMTPLGFTRAGWRRVKSMRFKREADRDHTSARPGQIDQS